MSSGTLTSAYYSQAYTYDAQGRLTSGAIGSAVYGDSSHPHAVTSIGGGAYTASYDAAGDMTCRAPNSSVTCAGTPTGQIMTYDAERRLSSWQNTPTTPTVQAVYLYDGEGNRIETWVDTSGTQTTTGYLMGGVEERASTGTITKYLGAKGLPTAIRVGTAGALNYLASDGLGSVSVAVDGSGNVVASQLFGPYGTTRYSNGTMPTSKGFTGQRADATTGLDYYGARYYDPVAGQFVSADSPQYGLSRYAYVGGNPETANDPSGHRMTENPGAGYSEAQFQADLVTWEARLSADDPTQITQYGAGKYIAPGDIVDQTGGQASDPVMYAASMAAIAQDQNGGFRAYGINQKNHKYGLHTAGAGVVTITYLNASGTEVTVDLYSQAVISAGKADTPEHAEQLVLAQLVGLVNAWYTETGANDIGDGGFSMSFNVVTGNPTCNSCAKGGTGDTSFASLISNGLSMGKYQPASTFTVNTFYVSPYASPGSEKDQPEDATPSTTTSYLYSGGNTIGPYNAFYGDGPSPVENPR